MSKLLMLCATCLVLGVAQADASAKGEVAVLACCCPYSYHFAD